MNRLILRYTLAALITLASIGAAAAQYITPGSSSGGGGGTVTSVSVTTQNGVSAVVTNPTTAPALAFTLGAITPSTAAIGAGAAITSSGPGGVLTSAAYTAIGTSGATIPLLNAINTWAAAQTFTAAPVFTDAAGSRTALGLGTAAVQNVGTSGATVPLLSTANTWASGQVFVAPVLGTPASGDASNLTNVPAGNLTGTVPTAVMGNAAFVRFKLLGANLNTTADQPITITLPAGSTRFKMGQATVGLVISNPSISMTTAVCGLWTGASKSGVTIVGSGAAGVAMSGLTSTSENTNGNTIGPAVNNQGTTSFNLTGNTPANTLYFACSTAQGATATADVTGALEVLN